MASGEAYGSSADDGGEGAAALGRRQVRGSATLLVGRLVAMLLTTATQIVIVRVLSKTDFGAFAYALVLASAGQILLSLGQGRLLSRFMSMYEERRDYDRMFGAMVLAGATILVTSTLALGTIFLFSETLVASQVGGSQAATVVLVLVFLAPLEALDQVFVSLFAVFSKPRTIFVRKYLLIPGLRLGVVVVLVTTGAGVLFLAAGYLAAQVIGVAFYVALLVKVLRERGLLEHLRWRRLVLPYRDVFAFSFPLITGELVHLSMNAGGVVLLGYFRSIAEVADYRAVFPAARLNQVVFQVFVTLYLPMASRLHTRGDLPGLRSGYWRTAAFLAVFTFPIFALTVPFAPVTTPALFGERYAGSAIVLALLASGYYFNVMLGFNTYTLQVCGRIRYLVGVNLAAAVLNLGLSIVLVPRLGAPGVAVANFATLMLQNLLNQFALRSSLDSRFVDRAYLHCYAAIVLAAGALWAFEVLASPDIILSVAATAVASAVVLLVSRNALQLAETFPELMRVPLLRRVLK